jgi:amino acid transporter
VQAVAIYHYGTVSTLTHGVEKVLATIARVILSVILITMALCLIINVVIPFAARLLSLVGDLLTSFLVHIFRS